MSYTLTREIFASGGKTIFIRIDYVIRNSPIILSNQTIVAVLLNMNDRMERSQARVVRGLEINKARATILDGGLKIFTIIDRRSMVVLVDSIVVEGGCGLMFEDIGTGT